MAALAMECRIIPHALFASLCASHALYCSHLVRREALPLSEKEDRGRRIWSGGFGRLPEEAEICALEETLLDPDTPFWSDAASLRRYLELTGLSQAACARRLGRSQAAVANRLRVLKLPDAVRDRMRAAALTERHARALLRLPTEQEQLSVLKEVTERHMTVAETEARVDAALRRKESDPGMDAELERLLEQLRSLRRYCPEAVFTLDEEPQAVVLSIRFPKKILSGSK